MTLDDIEILDATDLHLRHPGTGELLYCDDGSPMTIRLCGRDSRPYRAELSRFQQRMARDRKTPSPAELEEHSSSTLAACTLGWNLQGKTGMLPFSADAARQLYTDRRWIREQADEWVGTRANFTQSNSPP